MSYTIASNVKGLDTGEVAVTLDTGELVAVRTDPVSVDPITKRVSCHAYARMIDTSAVTQGDANGHPITAQHIHVSISGSADVAKNAVLAVLGEGSTDINDDIRDAIASASISGAPDLSSIL